MGWDWDRYPENNRNRVRIKYDLFIVCVVVLFFQKEILIGKGRVNSITFSSF
jgi:hypothetical protein